MEGKLRLSLVAETQKGDIYPLEKGWIRKTQNPTLRMEAIRKLNPRPGQRGRKNVKRLRISNHKMTLRWVWKWTMWKLTQWPEGKQTNKQQTKNPNLSWVFKMTPSWWFLQVPGRSKCKPFLEPWIFNSGLKGIPQSFSSHKSTTWKNHRAREETSRHEQERAKAMNKSIRPRNATGTKMTRCRKWNKCVQYLKKYVKVVKV